MQKRMDVLGEKKIGVIDYGFFDYLDSLREQHDISNEKWAELSGVPFSRISAYRKRAKNRAFTYDKVRALANGIEKVIGGNVLRKELIERIDKEKSYASKSIVALILGWTSNESEEKNEKALEGIFQHIMAVLKAKD